MGRLSRGRTGALAVVLAAAALGGGIAQANVSSVSRARSNARGTAAQTTVPRGAAAQTTAPTRGALYTDGPDGRYLLGGRWLFRLDPSNVGLSSGYASSSSTAGWSTVSV